MHGCNVNYLGFLQKQNHKQSEWIFLDWIQDFKTSGLLKFVCTETAETVKDLRSSRFSFRFMNARVFLQIQKRSGAWFFKGNQQHSLPAPLPLSRADQSRVDQSRPDQSGSETSSDPSGRQTGSEEPRTRRQGPGNPHVCVCFLWNLQMI